MLSGQIAQIEPHAHIIKKGGKAPSLFLPVAGANSDVVGSQ
jgi:hypothetical protein